MRELALVLLELRLAGPVVDLRQEIALLHHLAFREADLLQLAADLGLHGDRGERGDGPESFRMTRMSPLSTVAAPTGCGGVAAPGDFAVRFAVWVVPWVAGCG